ncbi:MAG TPA: hypothetical protein VN999_16540, partial [Thermoanaerobaculia bacterium]|nr:hypothetical protein [Thermoanaerobaculia bacterium]
MTPRTRRRRPALTLLSGLLAGLLTALASAAAALGSPAAAPGGGPAAGLRGDDRVTLPGHVHPLARA